MSYGPKKTLTLSTVTLVDDNMGGDVETWTSGKSIEGVFSVLSDRERIKYGKKGERADYKFIVDYVFSSGISMSDRFISGTRVFEIVGKDNPLERNHEIIFLLFELVS